MIKNWVLDDIREVIALYRMAKQTYHALIMQGIKQVPEGMTMKDVDLILYEAIESYQAIMEKYLEIKENEKGS